MEARVETLEQDNSALQEKASKLQEKAKTLAKEKKGIFFFLCSFHVAFVSCAHVQFALTELKSLLLKKDELVTDLTNVMYRQTDAVEKLTKIKADSDKQLVKDMKQIKDLAADRDQKAQQLADLEVAAQVVIGMVEEGDAGDKSLLERLCVAPQRLSSFFSNTSREYLAHALGLVKSFLPSANLALIGDVVAVGCSEEKFSEYVAEMKPIANKVISGLEMVPEGEA